MTLPKTALFAIGIPALVSGLVGAGIHAYLAASPPPLPQTVAAAVIQRSGIRMVELIRAGADPRLPVEARVRGVAGDQPVRLTPLALAAARNEGDFVRLLVSIGIAWSEEEKHDAYCVAVVTTHKSIEPMLANPRFDRSACPMRVDGLRASP